MVEVPVTLLIRIGFFTEADAVLSRTVTVWPLKPIVERTTVVNGLCKESIVTKVVLGVIVCVAITLILYKKKIIDRPPMDEELEELC